MSDSFVPELQWRGMVDATTPELEKHLSTASRSAYIGFDPTSHSLHIGSLAPIFLLRHFQKAGHTPIALVGGATGMIGDPSGKKDERKLLDTDTLRHNQECIQRQLEKFLDFDPTLPNAAKMVNNYDWMSGYGFLDFIRDIGKHISVNYMIAKDSVKSRIQDASSDQGGMSFTEFSYQLVQAYDFLHLYRSANCTIQMGGSDQWGNMTTGTELIRRTEQGDAHVLTCPLITKADGSKFGKTEQGNVWLDPEMTSPYAFYQFWLNTSDEDAEKFIRIFTFQTKESIDTLIETHRQQPHLRTLQRSLATDITTIVHSADKVEQIERASQVLFGRSTKQELMSIDLSTLDMIKLELPTAIAEMRMFSDNDLATILSKVSGFLPSLSEARRALQSNAIAINKEKVSAEYTLSASDLLHGKYIMVQRGKKTYYMIEVQA